MLNSTIRHENKREPYLFWMHESKSGEDVSSGSYSEAEERLEIEVIHDKVQLIGQFVHCRINITAKKEKHIKNFNDAIPTRSQNGANEQEIFINIIAKQFFRNSINANRKLFIRNVKHCYIRSAPNWILI